MRHYLIFATWAVLAGIGIPLIGVLNSGMARNIGAFAATAIMFAVAMVVAIAVTLPLYGFPDLADLRNVPPLSLVAGLLIGFYALSATIIIPQLGAASFVSFILVAQLLSSAVVDQFGLFGMEKRPMDMTKIIGLSVMVVGIIIMEIGNLRGANSSLPRVPS